jgi:hypothetical protein
VGNTTDPLQLAVATDRQGLWLAGEARVRRGTAAAHDLLNLAESSLHHPTQAQVRFCRYRISLPGDKGEAGLGYRFTA